MARAYLPAFFAAGLFCLAAAMLALTLNKKTQAPIGAVAAAD